ncbi:hypothetical protein MA16_Dca027401 [Dendrobium catenatum]|uniref:Uncharacterized protein n=1 Tax=Dendrobium catenatum TaxID=906689 RepID=A0A2I0VCZ3_9ASPA|nr:hypothetical protein MA16_Dca027401 [Dendrobium catenatum]
MMKSMKTKLAKIGKRDPNLKRLEKAVQKLDKISADVTPFFLLLESAKQEQKEQEVDFYEARQTGSLPTTNVLFGRGEVKEYVTQWLKKLSNEHQDRNISLLSIVGHGCLFTFTVIYSFLLYTFCTTPLTSYLFCHMCRKALLLFSNFSNSFCLSSSLGRVVRS